MKRVLIDPGSRNCRNMGDVAMLQVAVARIAALLPGVQVCVLTENPAELLRHCPGVVAVSHTGRELWRDEQCVWGRLGRVVPAPLRHWAARGQRRVRRTQPTLYRRMLRARFAGQGIAAAVDSFVQLLVDTDALVVCGQGTLADAAKNHAWSLLGTAELAYELAIPVFLFGQGVGPLADLDLQEYARAVLPRARLIGLREERRGRPLLQSLGVAQEAMVATGDDAIELAYAARPMTLGEDLGFHLRRAPLALPDLDLLDSIRGAVHGFVRAHRISIRPLPISHHPVGSYDPATIQRVLSGLDDASDGGRQLDTPAQVIASAGRCRVILTGAYHAAVFGLAQGVPVVCLGRSPYYMEKFEGLRDQFGTGVGIVSLDGEQLEARIHDALERAWTSAPEVHGQLLAAAARQIARGWEAYRAALAPAKAGRSPAAVAVAEPGARS